MGWEGEVVGVGCRSIAKEGYPRGLRETEICLGARIVAVAEAIDAMLTDRPYRRGASWDVVRQELIRCIGTYYDPGVVKAALDVPPSEWLDARSRPDTAIV